MILREVSTRPVEPPEGAFVLPKDYAVIILYLLMNSIHEYKWIV